MKSVPKILRAAADLIEPEGAWTQKEFARDAKGRAVPPLAPEAVCWCVTGAIERAAGGWGNASCPAAIQRLVDTMGGDVAKWNDARGRTQAEVVAALRKAADLAEASS